MILQLLVARLAIGPWIVQELLPFRLPQRYSGEVSSKLFRVLPVRMPVTIQGLRLGGLDEELANLVGLFDVLNMTIDMNVGAAHGDSGQDGVQVMASPGQRDASDPSPAREDFPQVPAPVTPVFTSSLASPIPGPGSHASG